ncbi:right-handed parallel beta-helix repeat-containing protein [Candidatus Woesearchaeota archaeon]|nr:right-handed parallel beta-helix repeat-containing protein [Candidatus Woesearchaeota archaeon]
MKKWLFFIVLLFVLSCTPTLTGKNIDPIQEFLNGDGFVVNSTPDLVTPVPQENKVVEKETFKVLTSVCGDYFCEQNEDKNTCPNDCLLGPELVKQVDKCDSPEQPQKEVWEVTKDVTLCLKDFDLPKGIIIENDGVVFDCNNAKLTTEFSEDRIVFLEVLANNVRVKNCNFENLFLDVGGVYYPKKLFYKKVYGVKIENNNFNTNSIPGYTVPIYAEDSTIKSNNFLSGAGISIRNSNNIKVLNNDADFIEMTSSESNQLLNNLVRNFVVLDKSNKNQVFSNTLLGDNFLGSITLLNSKENNVYSNSVGDGGFKDQSLNCEDILDLGIPLFPIGILGGEKNIINENWLNGFKASCGIYLAQTKHNKVSFNNIENFNEGIYLVGGDKAESFDNEFRSNTIKNNQVGISLKDVVQNNVFSENNFSKNEKQIVYNSSVKNNFENNFYDDYKGEGSYYIHTITPTHENGWVPFTIEDKSPKQLSSNK